jgi:thiol-disulfide isomerase/thioredoxin
MKYFLTLFSFMLLAFAACSGTNNEGYALKGNIKDAANLQVVLEQTNFDRTSLAIGKVACDANGNFKIEQKEAWKEGLYKMSIGAKKLYFMLDGKEKTIDVKGDLATIEKMEMEIKGSASFTAYAVIIKEMLVGGPQKTPEDAKNIVNKGTTPLMRAFLGLQLYGNNPTAFMAELEQLGKDLTAAAPGSKYTTDYNALIAQVKTQSAQQQAGELIKVGEMAPDISLPGPDGKTHSLAGLKGKIVLLDFWASWCGPCRKANPEVVEIYKKYKAKGFEVFSVSLDGADPRRVPAEQMEQMKSDGKTKWIAAIKQDQLIWENHVSDLQHWGSAPAATYGVSSIPKTFLIGRDGKIVAINPRTNLEQELLKVL